MSDELVRMILDDADEKMASAVAHTRAEFAAVRTGRANPSLVEKLPVEYYGSEVPMQQLAGFSVPEARTLLITPFDKGALGDIEKSLQQSGLGLNPSSDGNVIRLIFPQLTEERRREYVRLVKGKAEDGRIQIRNQRRAARQELESLERDGDLSEDDLARAEKELDKVTQKREAEIDQALDLKEQELLEV